MQNRRKNRLGLKVIHSHRVGQHEFRRLSDLIFVEGTPKAIPDWINVGGVRAPMYLLELDPAKLRKAAARENTYYYEGVTIDPRYEDLEPAPREASEPSAGSNVSGSKRTP